MSEVEMINGIEYVWELDNIDGIKIENGDLENFEIVREDEGVFIVVNGEGYNYNIEIKDNGEYVIKEVMDNDVKVVEGNGNFEYGNVVKYCDNVIEFNEVFKIDLSKI